MSYELYRLMGLVSILLMFLVPIVVGITSGSLLLSNISVDVNIYWLIANIIIQIVVLILFLGAMSGFAKYYNDSKIYQNSLYAVILGIGAAIISPIFTHVTNILIPTFLNFVFGMVYLTIFVILSGFLFGF